MTDRNPWRSLTAPAEVAQRLVDLYEREGAAKYDEAVSQTQHAVQAAELAELDGAPGALVAAALLHDIGHLLSGDHQDRHDFRDRDLHHEDVAARFLARWFGADVTEPIRLHVAAKRYLCAVESGYSAGLSPASIRSLELQGGPMTPDESVEFAKFGGAAAATSLRRWDDLAKDPTRSAASIAAYTDLLAGLVHIRT